MNAPLRIKFIPPGPVAEAFYYDRSFCSAIMGPLGSAKTSTSLLKAIPIARAQHKSPIDGIRRFRFVVIRDTYRNLANTTIPSWQTWFPPTMGEWRGGGTGDPAQHKLMLDDGDGLIDMHVVFIGLGSNRVETVMKGFEPTCGFINEGDMLPASVRTYLKGRVGRYPSKIHGGAAWYGLWEDFNAPDDDNHCYDLFVEDLPKGHKFYRQPSGLASNAENKQNLPKNYYQNQMLGQPDWWIRRYVKNQFGYSREGQPVYSEFVDDLHVAGEPLKPVPGLPIRIGMDAGRTPAAVLCQRMPNGQWRIIDELVCENMGAETFGKLLAVILREKYQGFDIEAWGDPAAQYKSDTSETSWLDIVGECIGVKVRPAPCGNNDLTIRLEAVRHPLTRMIDGEPGLLLSPVCKKLRKGFNSGYCYKRLAVGGAQDRFMDKPDKTSPYSHPHDAAQYVLVGGGEGLEVRGRKRAQLHMSSRPHTAQTDFDPFARAAY